MQNKPKQAEEQKKSSKKAEKQKSKKNQKNKEISRTPKKDRSFKKPKKAVYYKKPVQQRIIAKKRIKELFKQAESIFNKDKALANRYVHLARKLAMKFKIRIPSALKRRFCKHCYHYLMPGENCTVRLNQRSVVYFCKDCNKKSYFPYIKEQNKKRSKKSR